LVEAPIAFANSFDKNIWENSGRTYMIRKHTPSAALAALPFALALVLPAQAQNTAPAEPVLSTAQPATTPTAASIAAAPPLVIAEPSPPANMAFAAPRGVVISRPGCNAARISMGSKQCLKVGSRIEYLRNGLQFATGTITSLNYTDAVATVSPMTADHYVNINTDFRVLEIPAVATGPTQEELDDREFNRFERQFAISVAIAAGIYYAFIND
jgi:hypothetical protein